MQIIVLQQKEDYLQEERKCFSLKVQPVKKLQNTILCKAKTNSPAIKLILQLIRLI